MKSTVDDLCKRVSCRKFKPEQISEEELDSVLLAGTHAPTGRNAQSPVIVAVQDKDTIKKLSEMNAKIMGNEGMDPFFGAPTVIVVLADKAAAGTYVYDGSLVMGNMLNAASALNLGACWIHRAKEEFETEEGKKLLNDWGIKGDYEGIGHCILGYPDGEMPLVKKHKENYIYKVK